MKAHFVKYTHIYIKVGMNCSCGFANSKEFPKIVKYTNFTYLHMLFSQCKIYDHDHDNNGLKS